MGNTWDERMTPRPKAQPKMELARTLWTMTRLPNKPITAAIYEVESGRELRVHLSQQRPDQSGGLAALTRRRWPARVQGR
jgi:hypothetical protein